MKRPWFYIIIVNVLATLLIHCQPDDSKIFMGMGAKVGEMTDSSAIVHVRLTKIPKQNSSFLVPGQTGYARLMYGLDPKLSDAETTKWRKALSNNDFSIQFHLNGLKSGKRYYFQAEMKKNRFDQSVKPGIGSFKTAFSPHIRQSVEFQVTTGQDFRGIYTYYSMQKQEPDFLVSTGDNVYYDDEAVKARTVNEAYKAYQAMYGQKPIVEYFRHIGGYFQKDDHDYRFNDSDPFKQGRWITKDHLKIGESNITKIRKDSNNPFFDEAWLTHEQGIMVFKKVFPIGEKTYRTFCWGEGIQIWLLEGRDYRSPNHMPDGPQKTLWGKQQKEWLYSTLLSSNADYRIVISPTPIIGPDQQGKRDNHANKDGFWTEGQSFLSWIIQNELENVIIICGDRHWQYHSIYKKYGFVNIV
jgi:alkaline phosphatase D